VRRECTTAALGPTFDGCAYKYKICADANCKDPIIMIDP